MFLPFFIGLSKRKVEEDIIDYRSLIISDFPVAYWRLGESSGTTANDEVGTYNGTYVNAPTLGTTGLLVGDTDTATTFVRANSNYVSVPTSFDNWFHSGARTIEAWFSKTSTVGDASSSGRIVAKDTFGAGGYGWAVGANSNNVAFFQRVADGTANAWTTPADSVLNDTPYHMVVVYDGSNLANEPQIWLNGVRMALTKIVSATGGQAIGDDSSAELQIGNNDQSAGSGDRFFDGVIDEVAMYDRALTAQEIAEHYLTGSNAHPYYIEVMNDSPVAYWRLGESSGTTAVDEIGVYDATYTNSPTLGATGLLLTDSDTAVTFNGSTQYIKRSVTNFRKTDTAGTIEGWFSTISTATACVFASSSESNNAEYLLVYQGPNEINLRVATSNVFILHVSAAASGLNDGNPHHFAITSDGSTTRIFVDGVERTLTLNEGTTNNGQWFSDINADTANVTIGALNKIALSAWYQGTIDEVAIYDRALTEAEVGSHYLKGSAATYSQLIMSDSPVTYWRLGESVGISGSPLTFIGDNGAPPDQSVWYTTSVTDANATRRAEIQSNELEMEATNLQAVTGSTNLFGRDWLTGDFDIEIDISSVTLTGGDAGNLAKVGAYLRLSSDETIQIYALLSRGTTNRFWTYNGVSFTDHARTNNFGGVRFSRVGTTITIWTKDGAGAWVSRSSRVISDAPAYFFLNCSSDNLIGVSSTMRVSQIALTYGGLAPRAVMSTTPDQPVLIARNLPTFGATGLIANDADTAITLNGTDQYLDTGAADFRSGDSAGTIEAWFSLDAAASIGGTVAVFGSSPTGGGDWQRLSLGARANATKYPTFIWTDGATQTQLDIEETLSNDTIYHMVVVSDGSTYKMYLNGLEKAFVVAQGADNGNWFADLTGAGVDRITLGAQYNHPNFITHFPGTIDEVAVYDRALSAAEVAAHYATGT